VAGRTTRKGRTRARARKTRIGRPRRQLRLVWLLALVGLAVYLYYRPLASYLDTRGELAERRAEVETLRIVKSELEARLVSNTSVEATRREARRIGYVLPGEQLFVVKGIPDWRRAQRTLRDDG
jgi:hypothetical protein